jgi:hypothetical protein
MVAAIIRIRIAVELSGFSSPRLLIIGIIVIIVIIVVSSSSSIIIISIISKTV